VLLVKKKGYVEVEKNMRIKNRESTLYILAYNEGNSPRRNLPFTG
jgi:hypothetical protein